MPLHVTVNDSLHSFSEHSVQTETFTTSGDVTIYDATENSAAQIVGILTDGTNSTKVIAHMASHSSSIGIDVTEFEIAGQLIDASYTAVLSGDNAVLRVTGQTGTEYTFKYYAVVNDLL